MRSFPKIAQSTTATLRGFPVLQSRLFLLGLSQRSILPGDVPWPCVGRSNVCALGDGIRTWRWPVRLLLRMRWRRSTSVHLFYAWIDEEEYVSITDINKAHRASCSENLEVRRERRPTLRSYRVSWSMTWKCCELGTWCSAMILLFMAWRFVWWFWCLLSPGLWN